MNDEHTQQELVQEGAVQKRAGDLMDTALLDISRYVNTVTGDRILAEPDNEIRHILVALLLAYEERRADAS